MKAMELTTKQTLISIALMAALAGSAHAQTLRTETVLPQTTDPAITGWLSAHYVAFAPKITHRNLLFLYLHGQGGTGAGATALVKTAAEEGFYAVGLTYPNGWSPFNVCAGDPACPENLRSEIIDGTDRTSAITVTRPNSIENRLIKLLAHLAQIHPDEGWDQFTPSGSIAWDRLVVWGHSMGGGNTGVIARQHLLARACFSAPAADGGPGDPAAWWAIHLTPASSCFGFCHTQDSLSTRVAFWDALGMNAFGPLLDVAANSPPFSSTHKLSTSIAPAVAGQYHNSVITDNVTPLDPTGIPVYKPVWRYMMTSGLSMTTCYANCDGSATPPILTANDFQCFLNSFAAQSLAANCDGSTAAPTLTANDFQCFLNSFAAGCS